MCNDRGSRRATVIDGLGGEWAVRWLRREEIYSRVIVELAYHTSTAG